MRPTRQQGGRKKEARRGVDAELEPEFEAFWQAWPQVRRCSMGHARLAYAKARRIASAEQILAGAQRYAADCAVQDREPRFICYPATWLGGERWTDEYEPAPIGSVIDESGNIIAYPTGARAGRPLSRPDAIMAAGIAVAERLRTHRPPDPTGALRRERAMRAAGLADY